MNAGCFAQVLHQVRRLHPSVLLAVMPQWEELGQALADWPDLDLRPIAGEDLREQLACSGAGDLAVVADTLEKLAPPEGRALLAALRDLYSKACLVAVDA